jgi:hypothetical protein
VDFTRSAFRTTLISPDPNLGMSWWKSWPRFSICSLPNRITQSHRCERRRWRDSNVHYVPFVSILPIASMHIEYPIAVTEKFNNFDVHYTITSQIKSDAFKTSPITRCSLRCIYQHGQRYSAADISRHKGTSILLCMDIMTYCMVTPLKGDTLNLYNSSILLSKLPVGSYLTVRYHKMASYFDLTYLRWLYAIS